MSDLREDLDRALRALPVSEAPLERTRRDGRRLRTRRRAAVLAGALAVAAVAAGYPALTRGPAASGPVPSTLQTIQPAQTQTPAPALPNGDPVITGSPAGTTEGPDGLVATSSVVARGTVGAATWQVAVKAPGAANPVPADPCFAVTLSTAPPGLGSGNCTDLPPQLATVLHKNGPAAFAGLSDNTDYVLIGEVTSDVTYFIVTFTDGQRLKLLPVLVGGRRYIAWIAPVNMVVELVEAHLGSPYADSGQEATAAPFDRPGTLPIFGLWQQPGQSAPSRDSVVIGAGTAAGHAWKATAYEGPWGTCVIGSGGSAECVPSGPFTKTAVLGGWGGGNQPDAAWGSAARGVTTVRVALSNGKTVEVHPVGIGDEDMFAFWPGKDVTPKSWTAYDAAGQPAGSGAVK